MPKISMIGAGSTVFAKNLMVDILSFPELADCTLSLHDIDEARLHTSEVVAHKIAKTLGASPTIEATTDRRRSLDGADYAICMIQVGGYKPSTVIDFEIPKKYGLQQTIADTLGIGGIMRGLRTIPVLLDMCRDMEELCPDVTFLQYVNPMAINCWALNRATSINTIGLCHSVQGTAGELAQDLNIPADEINYICAGINHMAFYLNFDHNGEDLYPRLRDIGANKSYHRREYRNLAKHVRYEMLKRTGYFVTESSEHFSEYVPWFIKRDRPDLLERFEIPIDEYIERCEEQIAAWNAMGGLLESDFVQFAKNPADISLPLENLPPEMRGLAQGFLTAQRSHEYGSLIIHSMETGEPRVVYGNVSNDGLIDNLPQGCCVEVPVLVDKNGIQPTKVGELPPHLAALMQTNINVQALTVEAALTKQRDHIYHAAMLDPHTAAELDLEQIWNMVDELIDAHGSYLPIYE